MYYACANRKKLGKKRSPCPWLKEEAIEKFILNNLKVNVITRDTVKQGLKYLQTEEALNRHEDDTEKNEVESQIKQAYLEQNRLEAAVKGGVHYEAFADSINELYECPAPIKNTTL